MGSFEEQQIIQQRELGDRIFKDGGRALPSGTLSRYIVSWALFEMMEKAIRSSAGKLSKESSILIMCAGEAHEGTILCDEGYTNITISDISPMGVESALKRDPRLKGVVLNAQDADVPNDSYDFVFIQHGLHHLPSPVAGLTEMLRIARFGAAFIEPHDSLVGNLIGRDWEWHDDAVNYVFRWDKKLVQDVCNSYLGPDSFTNKSFSFWHHNPTFFKMRNLPFSEVVSVNILKFTKSALDTIFRYSGNQICGLVILNSAKTTLP